MMTDYCQFAKSNGAAFGAVIAFHIWAGEDLGLGAIEQAKLPCESTDKPL